MEHGVLLPREVEAEAIELYGLVGNLFTVDVDEDAGVLIYVDGADDVTLDAMVARAEQILRDLQDHRRDPEAARKALQARSAAPAGGARES